MSKVCKICDWENEDNAKFCVMCNSSLSDTEETEDFNESPVNISSNRNMNGTVVSNENNMHVANTVPQVSSGTKRFVVNCENSRTKTIVSSANITSFYCEGCKEEHQIDGFFWIVQEETYDSFNTKETSISVENPIENRSATGGQHLILEDIDTHMKIEISGEGGTLGRYGTYGSTYFQSDPRGRMVSGEHCRFKYEYGRWSIEHLSRTNDTMYNGRKLEHGYEEGVRDGKIITLANAISFIVRIV